MDGKECGKIIYEALNEYDLALIKGIKDNDPVPVSAAREELVNTIIEVAFAFEFHRLWYGTGEENKNSFPGLDESVVVEHDNKRYQEIRDTMSGRKEYE